MSDQIHFIEFLFLDSKESIKFKKISYISNYIVLSALFNLKNVFAHLIIICVSEINGIINNIRNQKNSKYFGTKFQDTKWGNTYPIF